MPRLRYVVAVGAVVWLAAWMFLIGAHNAMGTESSATHPAHALKTSVDGEFTVNVDHPHVGKGSPGAHHEQFTAAVLPRSGSAVAALLALGVVAAVVVAGWLVKSPASAGRGPPRVPAFSVTGQDVLTRFCLSRR
ncbi:hypothetical protein [Mycobacterium intracellulare]|uniref:hypothetical protein n=1 Tax=Mycobacterium intracellulare TaxID=1767 RepID=UPI000A5168DB|nr:hypothetical protein [Mycobacterium intracellulare]